MMWTVSSVECPTCKSQEMHPTEKKLLIRGFKVQTDEGDWSQCLVCSGYYGAGLVETPASHDARKGWFLTR